MDRRILFVAPGPIDKWASSRIRGLWIARHIHGAQIVNIQDGIVPDADVYIWIKKTSPELLERPGIHFWDVCDPIWWFQPIEAAEIASRVSAVVASNSGLAEDFIRWRGGSTPCYTIADRVDLEYYKRQRQHAENSKPLRLIWFGASQNRVSLFGALPTLERLKANGVDFVLTVLDDRPDAKISFQVSFPIIYTQWDLTAENEVLSSHDIAVLPPYPGEWGAVKSNNKHLSAWASGLAVWDGRDYDGLRRLVIFAEARAEQSEMMHTVVKHQYNVVQSAREWIGLIEAYSDD